MTAAGGGGGGALTDRDLEVLEAVIHTYIETAEPAGSQTVARRHTLGLSPASIRSTMSRLESLGYLYHPHASAGRVPTDLAYRLYVNQLIQPARPSTHEREALRRELHADRSPIEEILLRAAQVLGVLTQELGVAVSPALDVVALDRLDLVPIASQRLLVAFHLRSGAVRTIFVEIPVQVAKDTVDEVTRILNERLAGLTLREIRLTLADRLRDAGAGNERELLNIFVAEGNELFDLSGAPEGLVIGSAELLATQPEFASSDRIRDLLTLTARRGVLRDALAARPETGLTITIGSEHSDSRLSEFTLVTSSYRLGELRGVIGVIGPTRMPYDKIIGLVEHTSRMVEGLIE